MVDLEDIKKEIAQIAEIPYSAAWTITDSDPDNNLYLIHYRKEANLYEWGHIRGWVIDTKNKVVVCRPFGYTFSATLDKIVPSDDNIYHFLDNDGYEHVMNPETVEFTEGFEGPVIQVYLHNGIVRHSTHKKLDFSKTRWGNSKTFLEIWNKLGGPSDDKLFDLKNKNSSYCHHFLMVEPDLLISTKMQVGQGFLVYLGTRNVLPTDEKPYEVATVNQIPSILSKPFIYRPRKLTKEEATKFLLFGNYDSSIVDQKTLDQRLWPGEFIVASDNDNILRLQSPSYTWRLDVRNNEEAQSSINLGAYLMIDASRIVNKDREFDIKQYKRRFPILTPLPIEEIRKKLPIVVWPQKEAKDSYVAEQRDRLYNSFLCYLMSVPLHRQVEVLPLFDQVMRKRNELKNWLFAKYTDGTYTEMSDGVKRIINQSIRYAKENIKSMALNDGVKKSIEFLITREWAKSLYHLIQEMEFSQKPKN